MTDDIEQIIFFLKFVSNDHMGRSLSTIRYIYDLSKKRKTPQGGSPRQSEMSATRKYIIFKTGLLNLKYALFDTNIVKIINHFFAQYPNENVKISSKKESIKNLQSFLFNR